MGFVYGQDLPPGEGRGAVVHIKGEMPNGVSGGWFMGANAVVDEAAKKITITVDAYAPAGARYTRNPEEFMMSVPVHVASPRSEYYRLEVRTADGNIANERDLWRV